MSSDPRPQSPIRLGLLAILAVAVLGTAAWAVLNERPDDAVAASLGDAELTVGELNDILSTNPDNQILGESDGELTSEAPSRGQTAQAADELTGWLILEGVVDELEARGASVTGEHESEAVQAVIQGGVDPDTAWGERTVRLQTVLLALQEYADTEARSVEVDVPVPEWLCSRHILLETEEEALAVIAELESGMNFAAAAVEFSTGPSAPDGGDLGCVDAATFVPTFVDGARATGAGNVSAPVETQFGWHVIEVRAIGPLSAEAFPELDAETVETTLINAEAQARQGLVEQFFTEVVDVARDSITTDGFVDPRYGTWVPEQAFIEPPSGVSR